MVAGLSIDMSRHQETLLECLTPALQSSDASQRDTCVRIITAAAAKSSSLEPQNATLKSLVSMLTDKKAKLNKWEQRQSVLAAVRGLSSSLLSSSGKSDLANSAAELLLAYLSKVVLG